MGDSDQLLAFSWGYWGWGNCAPRLLEAVDAVERARGHEPPVFVDVRIRRNVRAVGFDGGAFQALLGEARHRWLPGLGNRHVVTGAGPRIQIADPGAAVGLFDLVREQWARRRRVLFFCACEWPTGDDGLPCHRQEVARLLRHEASKRSVRLSTVEWPGGTPVERRMDVPPGMLRAVRRGRKSIPLPAGASLADLGGLPWSSTVRLTDGHDELTAVCGPVKWQGGGWCLPVLGVHTADEPLGARPDRWALELRERRGLDARES